MAAISATISALRAAKEAIAIWDKIWPKKDPIALQIFIAAVKASTPIVAKETTTAIIEAIKNLGRSHKPYYSSRSDVCHIYKDCPVGSKIKRENKKRGTGDRDLCGECKDTLLNSLETD